MSIIFDSAAIVNHNPAFGQFDEPDYDAWAEDVAHMDAVCRGFVPL
jgi:hypothetical protein